MYVHDSLVLYSTNCLSHTVFRQDLKLNLWAKPFLLSFLPSFVPSFPLSLFPSLPSSTLTRESEGSPPLDYFKQILLHFCVFVIFGAVLWQRKMQHTNYAISSNWKKAPAATNGTLVRSVLNPQIFSHGPLECLGSGDTPNEGFSRKISSS